VARLMQELGVAGATVVGHSMGGAVAQRLAAQHPELVDRLVLVASVNAGERRAWERARRRLRGMRIAGPVVERNPFVVRSAIRVALRVMVHDPRQVTREMVDGYTAGLARPGTARCMVQMARCAFDEEILDLGSLHLPTLVISGASDRAVPPEIGDAIAQGLADARHVVLPDTGHLVPEEAPGRLHALLEAFLSGSIVPDEPLSRR
jgi:pimeloyl-ACP methyl ester carboxylesterase